MQTSWKKFLQASLAENIKRVGTSATYASLATITTDNKPAVRTVVIRGFVGEHHTEETGWKSDLLVITTNKGSHKIKELEANPYIELNWYMNGTMEQFRISGTIDIIKKNFNQSQLDNHFFDGQHLKKEDTRVEGQVATRSNKSLALQSFLIKQQLNHDTFDWQGERLRQFIELGSSMRAQMVYSQKGVKELEIKNIDPMTGWFKNEQVQDLLEEAFDNFTLLIVKVTSVRHWSPSTGLKVLL
ncbi:pyridoxamine 5'-phosphate oxidase-domain-containing protein [Cokeromyces recurvatus]|uniref:pyridoxamine 5'-phosphate oxidase-domain-containing protein n=1 Tax=Cokeromyces recurvatus TaxID=90255 RepID=UPI0022203652|nr:pyridoxamine 5'-phosphate oxidase-domain-containing protein [Cokeromyces recurvatus]KAI7898621.1 pyridoxamine 5'-phosphate oxidase-domain-containing protein [Cokeromyces recurvatus]